MTREALFHGPGTFSALAVYRGRFAIACSEQVIVGWSDTQTFVQVAADTREDMLFCLRRARPADAFLDEELIGGQIGDGREPFGFRDGLRAPTREEVERLAMGPTGTWLLYVRFEQALDRFAALPMRKREDVMGVTTEGVLIPSPPKGAHVPLAREYGRFIRRGFPYRKEGVEGLAFIAAATEREVLEQAYDVFQREDTLTRYASAVSRGLFFIAA